jgi:DNA-binding response OmpR family regulator
MPDPVSDLFASRAPTPNRPLLGLTVLVVEDSRFASEAMRLLCLRSGARIRRADSLKSAHRHLAIYRPAVAIVDLGLPDGSGLGLISELANTNPRVNVVLAISGEPASEPAARAAGADGFLQKPISSLSAFQAEILSHLPPEKQPRGLRLVANDEVQPDRLALLDDLAHVSDLLTDVHSLDHGSITYAVQFLQGLARLADDPTLSEAASRLSAHHVSGEPIGGDVARIAGLVQQELQGRKAV